MPQNATLSPVQETALAALLAGQTVTDAAAGAGIDRATLHRWLRGDFVFQARLNAGRREIRDAVQARLLRLADEAAAVVESDIKTHRNVKTALAVLCGLGLLPGEPTKIGSDDPAELREDQALIASLSRLAGIQAETNGEAP